MYIIPEEIEHMIQSFLFTYPEVDCIAVRSANPKFVNYMKNIAVRTVKIQGANVEFYMDGVCHNEESPTIIRNDSYWYKNGILHSENDKPAVVGQNGNQYWFRDGKSHRGGDKPAVMYQNGDQYWFKDGYLHREDGKPAIVCQNGDLRWYKDGYPCRENGKPIISIGAMI